MSVVLNYENQSIQHSDIDGNIAHQGILASNLSGTTNLTSTFPTTSTGTSIGHYHYTEPITNALKFLNVSGTGEGGHKFYSANSTTAPVNTATIDVNGLTIDKSVIGTPQTININDDITLTTGTKSTTLSTSLLRNSTIKTTLDFDNNTLNFVDTLGTTQTTMTSSNYQITNGPENVSLGLANNRFFISNSTDITSNIYLGQVQQTNLTTENQTVLDTETLDVNKLNTNQKSSLSSSNLTINDLTTNLSVLSATDLTFNSVSLPSTVSTNTTNISNNTNDITNLTIKQITSSNQFVSSAITADGRPPIAPTNTIIQTYAFSPAWYFKNSFSSGVNKINWYLGPSVGMTVADVLGLYMNIFNGLTTSNDDTPFIVIYTANDSVPPVNFYKSKRTYLFNQSITPVANTRYFNFANISTSCPTPNYYGSNLINMELSTVAGSQVGAFASTELILAFAINTNSASVINSVEFAINKFGIMTPFGTQEVLFIPSS